MANGNDQAPQSALGATAEERAGEAEHEDAPLVREDVLKALMDAAKAIEKDIIGKLTLDDTN